MAYWSDLPVKLFINEYIYDSYIGTIAGRLIYEITSSKLLSSAGRFIARIVPSLRANTFGIGVRFRAHAEWTALFESLGYTVSAHRRGTEEKVSFPRRMLFIRSCRRDSYLLSPIESKV